MFKNLGNFPSTPHGEPISSQLLWLLLWASAHLHRVIVVMGRQPSRFYGYCCSQRLPKLYVSGRVPVSILILCFVWWVSTRPNSNSVNHVVDLYPSKFDDCCYGPPISMSTCFLVGRFRRLRCNILSSVLGEHGFDKAFPTENGFTTSYSTGRT